MAVKETVMVLKVDLQCSCCYKKVKKILCKYPQIRNQIYNEKADTVTITVVCCDPEKIRDKLCCKGYKVIKSIEIKEPPKPMVPEKPKPKEPEKPKKEGPIEPPKPMVPEKPKKEGPIEPLKTERPKELPKAKEPVPPKRPIPAPWPPPPEAVPGCGYPPVVPMRTCCGPCSEGYGGGPCYHGFGLPPPPQPRYDGYYVYDYGYGHGRGCHVTRCDYYFSEENPGACSIM